MKPKRFKDRMQAGELLAQQLISYAGREDVIVLALPRGGVPVGFSVATKLGVPLDILLVRKLGLPWNEEYAMGAIAGGGICVLQESVINKLEIPVSVIDAVKQRELQEIERREKLYRGDRPLPQLHGRIVILVDDGIATGCTMQAAVECLRIANPSRVIIAVPVAAAETCAQLRTEVDELICLSAAELFFAVGLWYENFGQTSDDEVKALLERAALNYSQHRSNLVLPR